MNEKHEGVKCTIPDESSFNSIRMVSIMLCGPNLKTKNLH